MKPIAFFDENITITSHSASEAEHVGRPVSVREFANGEPVGLYLTTSGDLLCKTPGYPGRFIEGVET